MMAQLALLVNTYATYEHRVDLNEVFDAESGMKKIDKLEYSFRRYRICSEDEMDRVVMMLRDSYSPSDF